MSVGALALVIAAFPIFMLGALSFAVRDDLGLTETAIGMAVAVSFGSAGLASTPCGRLVDTIGAKRSLVVGSLVTAICLGIIASAPNVWVVMGGMALGGIGMAVTEPGIATTLNMLVPTGRHGLAFGIKEAAIPGVTLLAGIAVPSVALTVGWRWAFAGGVVLVPMLWLLMPPQLETNRGPVIRSARPKADPVTTRALGVVAIGAALGVSAVTAMGTFLVDTGAEAGLHPGSAGMLLSVGSAVGIGCRITAGWFADRISRPALTTIVLMNIGGACALGMLAAAGVMDAGPATVVLVLGTVLAFGIGWGWPGLLFLSAVRATPHAPGSAAGIALAGLSVGGASGPLLFGIVVDATSYPFAWLCGAVVMLVGAVVLHLGQRMLAHVSHQART